MRARGSPAGSSIGGYRCCCGGRGSSASCQARMRRRRPARRSAEIVGVGVEVRARVRVRVRVRVGVRIRVGPPASRACLPSRRGRRTRARWSAARSGAASLRPGTARRAARARSACRSSPRRTRPSAGAAASSGSATPAASAAGIAACLPREHVPSKAQRGSGAPCAEEARRRTVDETRVTDVVQPGARDGPAAIDSNPPLHVRARCKGHPLSAHRRRLWRWAPALAAAADLVPRLPVCARAEQQQLRAPNDFGSRRGRGRRLGGCQVPRRGRECLGSQV